MQFHSDQVYNYMSNWNKNDVMETIGLTTDIATMRRLAKEIQMRQKMFVRSQTDPSFPNVKAGFQSSRIASARASIREVTAIDPNCDAIMSQLSSNWNVLRSILVNSFGAVGFESLPESLKPAKPV